MNRTQDNDANIQITGILNAKCVLLESFPTFFLFRMCCVLFFFISFSLFFPLFSILFTLYRVTCVLIAKWQMDCIFH